MVEGIRVIPCSRSLRGEIEVPGDKSISHRSIIIGSLTTGKLTIENYSPAEDCLRTLKVFNQLGIKYFRKGNTIILHGTGLRGLEEPPTVLDAGNSGTLMRLVLGLLAPQAFFSVITGDSSLRRRPMGRVIEPLRRMEAKIWSRGNGKFAPVAIQGTKLKGIRYHLPVASAQVKSALLLAGLYAHGETVVVEPGVCRDHTERMLEYFGAKVQKAGRQVTVSTTNELKARPVSVPGDFSSAAYLIAAALLIPGSDLLIKNVGINPTRTGLLQVLEQMGANLEIYNYRELNLEPRADIRIKHSNLKGVTVTGRIIGRLIDEIPILAVVATQAEGITRIRGAEELRVKESDRIKGIVQNLNQLGARVQELPDGMIIEGPAGLKGGRVSSFSDHRIAMSMVIAGLISEDEVVVEETSWIKTSFPGFVETLNRVIDQPLQRI